MRKNTFCFLLHYVTFFFCCMICDDVSAQNGKLQDVVYLHDGSIYRGRILESYPDSIIKIEIVGANVIVISAGEILQMTREEKPVSEREYTIRGKGFCNATTVGVLPGDGNFTNNPLGPFFETVNGYQFNYHVQTGINSTFVFINYNMLNLAANGRYNFIKSRSTPFVYADAGLCIPLTQKDETTVYLDKTSPGSYFATGFGFRSNPRRGDLAFILSIGYSRMQYADVFEDYINQTIRRDKYTLNRLALKIGFAY